MVDEEELEKLREQKKEELQGQSEEDLGRQEEAVEQQKQQIWGKAKSYMTPEAKDRLANIKTVDEQKALAVARQVAALGESGQISKIGEDQMKQILRSLQNQENDSNIKFRR